MAPVGLVTLRDHALPTDHTLKLFHILPDTPVSIAFPSSFCEHGMTVNPQDHRIVIQRGVHSMLKIRSTKLLRTRLQKQISRSCVPDRAAYNTDTYIDGGQKLL